MKILLIDNYDSFTWNLVRLLHRCGAETKVVSNDASQFPDLNDFSGIMLSPGPGLPAQAGNLLPWIPRFTQKPVLGICLGHQALACWAGAQLKQLPFPRHGFTENIIVTDATEPLFKGLSAFSAGLYHSWYVDSSSLPNDWVITASTPDAIPMAIAKKDLPFKGLQFHPESVMTPAGEGIIKNWLNSF